MCSFNPYRSEVVSIDRHRIILQIRISMVPSPIINISTCGREVSFWEIMGENSTEISLRKIDQAILVLEHAMSCIGQTVKRGDESFKLEVAGSKVVTVIMSNSKEQQKQ